MKIKIERPDADGAQADLHAVPRHRRLPIAERELKNAGGDPERAVRSMIDDAVDAMYATGDENKFLEVTYQNGDKESSYFKDFSSGAMIENIVRRAKKLSIKRTIAGGDRGHLHRRPARLDQAGVPRARGPAEHHEPRRLGEDLGQEGRAHRLRPHDRQRGRRATKAAVRSSGSPPVSTSDRATVTARPRR